MPVKRNSKNSAAKRRAANARGTTAPKKLTPAQVTKQKEQMRRYDEMMLPKRRIRLEEDRRLLRKLYTLFGGANKAEWRIVDPTMAATFPNNKMYKPV